MNELKLTETTKHISEVLEKMYIYSLSKVLHFNKEKLNAAQKTADSTMCTPQFKLKVKT